MFWLIWDWLTIWDENQIGTYPSMYNNFIAQMFLYDQPTIEFFGVFKWYDLFSVRGFDNWFWDA